MTMNSFYDSQFYASINHHTDTRRSQSMHCHDVISRDLPHAAVATQKWCGQFMFISITIHVQMHVDNGSKISSLCSYKYV